eukprot:Phypoly_transcript_05290.p1 GENE.Phypoly_transcript_05290~~Phypoly_transcript_05290.p1  ORF type:complete len:602 (+),score=148.51 Phypoly_transcript_05290:124-1929(+)
MSDFHNAIAQQIATLANITTEQALQCIEEPKNLAKADLAVVIAKINKFCKLSGNPAQIANEWKGKITLNNYIKSVSSEGPYLNFMVNKAILVEQVIKKVFAAKENWGFSNIGEGKKVVLEYSSPNIAKPFHAGHLRSTIIGNFLTNLHKMLGYQTVSINYLGDWGKQYGLLAVGFEKFGSEEKLAQNPIRHLFDVYVQINAEVEPIKPKKKKNKKKSKKGQQEEEKEEEKREPTEEEIQRAREVEAAARAYFRRMEDGDESALANWRRFRDISIAEYTKIYKRLNVEFDVYSGESMQEEGMKKAFKEMEEKNLLQEKDGAKMVNLEQYGLDKAFVQKSDGTTLYITRDIAAAASRYDEYHYDKMIYVVASQQDLHFQQLFKILNLLGKNFAAKCQHINFGMVLGMSTRTGKVKFLVDILDKAKEEMLKVMKTNAEKFAQIEDPEGTADLVGLSAVVVQDLAANRIKNYTFEWERVCDFEGDTGPYLQYQHARLCSMERKSGVKVTSEIDFSLLPESLAQDIARTVGKFPDVVIQAGTTLEPVTIVSYLFDLGHQISSAHGVLRVKGEEQKLAEARLALFYTARITLGNGLRLLGLKPLERM